MSKEIIKAEKLNLFQKLHRIQQQVNGLGKDKKAFSYSYTTGEKILDAIKPLMNEMGLMLVPSVTNTELTRQDYNSKNGMKSENTVKLDMIMTWVDVDSGETLPIQWGAVGQNDWDKGFGSALTYSERFFFLKFFHIATDKDDIDNPEIRKQIEEKLSTAGTLEELTELWNLLDAESRNKNKKKFGDRKKELEQELRLKKLEDAGVKVQNKSK